MGYALLRSIEVDKNMMPKEPGVINGGVFERTSAVPVPTICITVEDIDAAMEMVVKAGGMVVKDRMPAGAMGFMAYFSDTEGNIIGLWQNE
jgi:predicted enzyme related to lactoylglutathione lyase